MDFYSFPPVAAILDAAYSLVSALVVALDPISAAVAIVIVTVIVRSALIPVGLSQVRAELARRRLAPKLTEIQRRYRKNPELIQRKSMELYAAEKVSPFAGILPALAQAPVLSIVYGLFTQPLISGHTNALLAAKLVGVPLGAHLTALAWPGILVFVAALACIALIAVLSRRSQQAFTRSDATADAPAPALARWLSWLPLVTVAFAAVLPLAAGIYLATTTAWTLVERAVIRRRLLSRA